MPAKKKSFAASVRSIRERAVTRFLKEYDIDRETFDTMTWSDWHKLTVFADMLLTPLGGDMRFIGTDIEQIGYSFQNKVPGKVFGVTIEVNPESRWSGRVLTSEGDVDDAARAAITGLLELAYLRATQ